MQLTNIEPSTNNEKRFTYNINLPTAYCVMIASTFEVIESLILSKDQTLYEVTDFRNLPIPENEIEVITFRCSYQGKIIKFIVNYSKKLLLLTCEETMRNNIIEIARFKYLD